MTYNEIFFLNLRILCHVLLCIFSWRLPAKTHFSSSAMKNSWCVFLKSTSAFFWNFKFLSGSFANNCGLMLMVMDEVSEKPFWSSALVMSSKCLQATLGRFNEKLRHVFSRISAVQHHIRIHVWSMSSWDSWVWILSLLHATNQIDHVTTWTWHWRATLAKTMLVKFERQDLQTLGPICSHFSLWNSKSVLWTPHLPLTWRWVENESIFIFGWTISSRFRSLAGAQFWKSSSLKKKGTNSNDKAKICHRFPQQVTELTSDRITDFKFEPSLLLHSYHKYAVSKCWYCILTQS